MTQSYSLQPSLDNAYARVSRAKQHLTSLKRDLTKFLAHPSPIFSELEEDMADGDFIIVDYSLYLHRPLWSILVGECIYNLRAALDYLIYELAILDSRQIQKGTQFPIEDTPQGWKGRRDGSYLKGLSVPHKACIKTLQPCYGCNWTKVLRDISNPDKHKTLQIVRPSQMIEWNIGRQRQTSAAARLQAMEMDTTITYEVAFEDGRPVIETLQELQAQVSNVIDVFKPDFP